MKTNLPTEITTIEEATNFLRNLHNNGEAFHPECCAHAIVWDMPPYQMPNKTERNILNKLMRDIYNLPGNDGRHTDLSFDPCQFLLDIAKYQEYLRDNNLADDSDTITTADLRDFVANHLQEDDGDVDDIIDECGCVEDEDDRIFVESDMIDFARRMVKYARKHPKMLLNELNAYIENEAHLETGDDSFDTYNMPVRP